jgi:cytochrome P450
VPGYTYFTFAYLFLFGKEFALLHPRDQEENAKKFKTNAKIGATWKVTAGSENFLFTSSPEMAKEILVTKVRKFGKPPGIAQMSNFNPNETTFNKYFPDEAESLFSTNYDQWKRHRTLCNKAFSDYNIKRVVDVAINKVADKVVRQWEDASESGKPIAVTPQISAYATDSVSNSIFGVDFNTLAEPEGEIRHIIEQTFASALYFQLPRIFMFFFPLTRGFLRIWERWSAILKEIISKRRIQVKDGEERNDVLSNLINASEGSYPMLTTGELTRDSAEILGAGTDTTATTLSFTLYYLAHDAEMKRKVQEEAIAFIKQCENGIPDYDQLKQGLPYTKLVVNEVLRVHSPAPYIHRYTTEDVTAAGVFIPKGTNVTFMTCISMYDPDIWGDDANVFRPERFIDNPSLLDRNKFKYLPFSAGPRSCIGQPLAEMEIWLLLAKLLSKFDIELMNPKEKPEEDVRFSIVPKNPILLRIKRIL